LAKLRELSITHAKSVYMNVGVGQRWGKGLNATSNQAMLDDIDRQLRDLGVSADERRGLGANYVCLMGFDFYMLYARTLERYFQFKQQALNAELNRNPQNEQLKEEVHRWRDWRPSWKPNYALFSQLSVYSLEDELGRLSAPWLSERDGKSVDAFRNQVLSLFKATQTKGGLTKEAAEYLDTYSDLEGHDKKIIELFDFNPSEPR
jgi:hypothetical protein